MMDRVIKDRLVFKKAPKPKKSDSVPIRIKREEYEHIVHIANESGKSITEVTAILLKFAIMHVEYEEGINA